MSIACRNDIFPVRTDVLVSVLLGYVALVLAGVYSMRCAVFNTRVNVDEFKNKVRCSRCARQSTLERVILNKGIILRCQYLKKAKAAPKTPPTASPSRART